MSRGEQLRIVLVTNTTWPDKLGGLERYFRDLGQALAARGHEVVLLAKRLDMTSPAIEVVARGFTIRRFETASHDDPLFLAKYHLSIDRSLRALLRELRPDDGQTVVHALYPFQGEVLRRANVRYVYTCAAPVHKEIRSEHQGRFRMPKALVGLTVALVKTIERRAIEGADAVVAISDFTRKEVESFCTVPDGVEVILGGIDTTYFSPGVASSAIATRHGEPVLFAARRHVIRTGLENLVLAMPQVLRHFPDAHLYLSGDGPRRGPIEQSVQQLGLANRITLLGRVSDDEIRDWYRYADLSITPTLELEGFGLSTAEAMASGGVPLVTPVGSNPELVSKMPTGHVTPDASPGGLADGIIALETSRREGRLVCDTREIALPWDWQAVAERYERVYEKCLARGGPRSSVVREASSHDEKRKNAG